MSARGLLFVAVAAGLAGCGDGSGPPPPQASSLHVLHAIRGGPSLTVSVDGARGSTLVFGGQSRTFLSPGVHELVLVPSDTSHSLIVDFTAAEGVGYSAFRDRLNGGGDTYGRARDRARHRVVAGGWAQPIADRQLRAGGAAGRSLAHTARQLRAGSERAAAQFSRPDTLFRRRAGRLERRHLPRRHDRHADCNGTHRDGGWTSTDPRGARFDPGSRHLAAGAEPGLATRAAAANCRTISPAGSTLVMPLTLFPACQ